MNTLNRKVLVTYGWVRSSYASVRNLVGHGLEVVVADTNKIGMCQWSGLPSSKFRYTSYYRQERQFIDDIKRIVMDNHVNLILPSHNETEVLSKYRDEFPEDVCQLLPDYSKSRDFNNKSTSYKLAEQYGLPVPPRIAYKDPEDLPMAIRSAGWNRSVIKLLFGNSAKGVFYADTPEETGSIVRDLILEFNLPPERYPQVEAFVAGEGCGCSCLYWHGEPVASFSHRRLREKTLTGGTSTFRESISDPELENYATKLLSDVKWHGLAMVEFKRDPATGQVWFIEVNPRLWGSLHLAIASGFEFPYLAYLCATNGPEAAGEYHAKVKKHIGHKARWLLGDMIIASSQLSRFQVLDAWNTLFRQDSDSLDDWNPRDPFAFLGELAYYGKSFLRNRSTNPVEEGMIG